MENNSDKRMRDKLQGLQVPYDPQAWAAMEAMLDNKKKRRGIFWWWFGGVAASLLLGFGLYQTANLKIGKVGKLKIAKNSKVIREQKANSESNKINSPTNNQVIKGKEKTFETNQLENSK